MPIKVGINGFGRIGRNIARAALGDKDIEIVAVNDVTDAKTLAHLFKYDSILGNLSHKITHTEDTISVEGRPFKVFKVKDPAELDWASVGAQIVIESTGLFTKGSDAKKHMRGSREESNHLRSRHRPRFHDRTGSERQSLRSGKAQHHLERLLHYELSRARGARAAG